MPRDVTSSEISAAVYNTRNIKPVQYKPIRGLRTERPSPDYRHANQTQEHGPAADSQEENSSVQNKEKEIDENQYKNPLEPVSCEKLFARLRTNLATRIERADQAQEGAAILKKIRRSMSIEDIIQEHLKQGFLIQLLSSSDSVCRFQFLVEEVLAFTLPLTRAESHRQRILDDILSNGALIFSLCALKQYLLNPNVRTLATELLATSISFILDSLRENSKWSKKKYASINYLVHEIVLHSGVSVLPELLAKFISSQTDIGVRRALKCIKFIVTHGSSQVLQNIAAFQRFSLIRNCISVVRSASVEAQIDAAFILTGLAATSLLIAEKLIEFNGWDEVRTLLTTPSLDFSEIPATWLENSSQAVRIVQLKFSSKPMLSLDLDFVVQEESPIAVGPLSPLREKSSKIVASQLASLPSSYWIQPPQTKVSDSTQGLPKCKDRLLGSPFGDSKKLFRIQQKKAHQAKISQKKLWEQKSSPPIQNTSTSEKSPKDLVTCPPINRLPKETHKNLAVAERLFGLSNAPDDLSPIDQLSYEERLQVMMMQVRDSSSGMSP